MLLHRRDRENVLMYSSAQSILVTGATGQLGRLVVIALARRIGTGRVIALARDPITAIDLKARGVEVRQGNYSDQVSLRKAIAGIGRVCF